MASLFLDGLLLFFMDFKGSPGSPIKTRCRACGSRPSHQFEPAPVSLATSARTWVVT